MTTTRAYFAILLLALSNTLAAQDPVLLPNTKALEWKDDITSRLVEGVDRFLLRETEQSIAKRAAFWHYDFSSPEKYVQSVEPNRKRLAHILGVRDPRIPFEGLELVGTTTQPALVGRAPLFEVFAVRWPTVGVIHGEGLLLTPRQGRPLADVVVIPDADQTPEQLAGLLPGVAAENQHARRLAELGCRVVVPMLINRQSSPINKIPNREWLYRSAFELGRHVIGYEIQKVLACVDWFKKETKSSRPIGVMGWGEGGMLALYSAALDTRIDAAYVSGYFGSRQNLWQEPIDRNVFGLLEQFGDAETASLIYPRRLRIDPAKGPELVIPSGMGGAAPGRLVSASGEEVTAEWERLQKLVAKLPEDKKTNWRIRLDSGSEMAPAEGFLGNLLGKELNDLPPAGRAEHLRLSFDPQPRHARQMDEMDRNNQALLTRSADVRRQFFSKLDTKTPEQFAKTVEGYRDFFAEEVIGRFDLKPLPPNVRIRKSYDHARWAGYEVVMDVFPDVIAYGILLLPKDLKPGEKRPVVVCQHGLEGRPQDTVLNDHPAYHDFAAKLAERGFITFAPQNLYIFRDRFRTLQRKANPIKKTLFSVIVPQHQQITDWLKTLPNVDPERIAFYGLSYGGKTAMRVPPLVKNYCLSICSADFNEWVWKNASTGNRYTYTNTIEYEIFEFDLGSTFNYAEMATLIAPRPFMVERGHFDGVAPDETVAYEFAKVRNLYQARLGLMDRCEIEWFVGPHTINGKGTYAFLHKHLKWPEPR